VSGLEVDWTEVEAIYERIGLPPSIGATASRVAVPVYSAGRQVGRATSTTWSPVLKKMIALATIDADYFTPGTQLEMEVTVEAVRHRVAASIVKTPFFNPGRKTQSPPL
jgi:aminomethyltransferase